MGTYHRQRDLERLRALRATLLGMEQRAPGAKAERYWQGARDLALYDETFARRIAWKWEAVLDELEQRGAVEPLLAAARAGVLDWGCGTGVAARTWAARCGEATADARITLWDRAPEARAFAAARLREEQPQRAIEEADRSPRHAPGLLLVSHVLDELEPDESAALVTLAREAAAVVWVEPGSRVTSRRLSARREELRGEHAVLAPCPHQERCGMLAPENERHWCHLFARPPQEAFTEGRWSELGRELSIDLRSLPYSYLALARCALPAASAATARVLGRPRHRRGAVALDLCREDGVHAAQLLERDAKALVKRLKKRPEAPRLLAVALAGERVTSVRELGSEEER